MKTSFILKVRSIKTRALHMRLMIGFFAMMFFISKNGFSQYQDYKIAANGDTLNRVDIKGMKQGPWVIRYEKLRGEPGFEEEGVFVNDRKEGEWRLFTLMGDPIGSELYRWGLKDGISRYFNINGNLRLEQSWKALNPDKAYDTLQVEEIDKLDSYKTVIVKNEGASLKHGSWKYYDGETGRVIRTERYELGRLMNEPVEAEPEPTVKKEVQKPKEVLDFEKKNSGKKKVRFKDGSTGGY